MEPNLSKVSVSLESGSFEVSGSEEFVREQVKSITEFLVGNKDKIQKREEGRKPLPHNENTGNGELLIGIENVVSYNNEKINIIAQIPGRANAKKVRNVALLYLYGSHSYKGTDEVGAEEIRRMCETHACLDGNFSTSLKSNKTLFIVDGGKKEKNQKVRITAPGLRAAEKLIKEINVPKAE